MADPADGRIAAYRSLKDRALRDRLEAAEGVFLVEGVRALRVLLGTSWPLVSILLLEQRAPALGDLVEGALERGAAVYLASGEVLDGVAGFHVHRGALGLAVRRPLPDPGLLLGQARTAVVVEAVNDHENMGAIFRNAAALGADAVLLDPASCDPLYRRSIRVSVGQVLRVPFSRLEPWPDALEGVRRAGFLLVALHPPAPAVLYPPAPAGNFADLPGPDGSGAPGKVALLVGSEGDGLSRGALEHADRAVRVPMTPGTDSLNVATALAVALHALGRC